VAIFAARLEAMLAETHSDDLGIPETNNIHIHSHTKTLQLTSSYIDSEDFRQIYPYILRIAMPWLVPHKHFFFLLPIIIHRE